MPPQEEEEKEERRKEKGKMKRGKEKGRKEGRKKRAAAAVRKIIALFLLPLHASRQFGMASGHNEGKFGASALI